MSSFINKENLVISAGEYEKDGKTKQEWSKIGEIVTMQGDSGPYQVFKLWGAGGVVEGKVFEQKERTAQPQQPQQAPQQNYQQAPPQQFNNDPAF